MRTANRLYENLHFAEAKKHYQEILTKSTDNLEAEEKLAHCYRRMNDSENAEVWYAKVVNNQRAESEDIYKISRIYRNITCLIVRNFLTGIITNSITNDLPNTK
jgi:thioredoxin-like negative regulator of GroEL